jgi:hypothetical protein
VCAAGGSARAVTFEPERERGPVTTGMLRPDAATVGVLRRIALPGPGFPYAIVGAEVSSGSAEVLIFGAGRPLLLAPRDGRALRPLALRDVTEAAFAPGEEMIAALAQGAVHSVDRASGAVLGSQAAAGASLRFAGPTRLAVDTQVLRFPELTPAFTIPDGTILSPRVMAHADDREMPKGTRTVIVVRRIEDGSVMFERDLGERVYEPLMGIHPSGRFVAWLGEANAGALVQGGILDVETRKVAPIPYLGIYRVLPASHLTASSPRSPRPRSSRPAASRSPCAWSTSVQGRT